MTVQGETICTGAPTVCPSCGKDALATIGVRGTEAAGFCIQTWCGCGPYTRESRYLIHKDITEAIAADVRAAVADAGGDSADRAEALRRVLTTYMVERE